ncbi:MAG: HIT domain-containing protein [Candidatus Acidiferrales bacterium]
MTDGTQEGCSFCEEIVEPRRVSLPLVADFFRQFGRESRVLLDDPEFFVVPTLGPLVAGHILILPKTHFYSVGEMPESMLSRLEQIARNVREILRARYGSCSAFEHGCVDKIGKAGACIDHAHLHLLPVSQNLRPLVERSFGSGTEMKSFSGLRSFVRRSMPYLYYEDPAGLAMAYEAPIAPSQYFRQLMTATVRGNGDWDWKRDIGVATVIETYEALKRPLTEAEDSVLAVQQ